MPKVMKKLRIETRGHEDALFPPEPSDHLVWEAPELWTKGCVWVDKQPLQKEWKATKTFATPVKL